MSDLNIEVAGTGKTFQEICEVIAASKMLTKKSDGTHPTAEEIFNYSPHGELFMIPIWYETVLLATAKALAQGPPETPETL